ncbi:hypothetical protein DQG23_32055 [Paenibacillus contaminans]|uniref:Uncharacterized protein n=1 Tax=Paenibacillus contaminans TaxID=450362 RepID=A0A329M3K5_9BACL|nr:hypothetical protein DQG23_32055 [Paenibacillus contaminans]
MIINAVPVRTSKMKGFCKNGGLKPVTFIIIDNAFEISAALNNFMLQFRAASAFDASFHRHPESVPVYDACRRSKPQPS